jgi:glycosyltransferase involved in cell wall biosynthesis
MSSPTRSPSGSQPTVGSTNRVRVGLVVHVMQIAGAEVLVAEIARRLSAAIEPTVFCLDAVGALGEQLRTEGISVVTLGRRPGLDPGLAWRFARELRRRRIEVIHAHQYTPFFYAACANALAAFSARVIFTEHGRHYPDVVSTRRRLLNRLVFRHLADDINAVCEFSARSLARTDGFVGRPIPVIANGVDVARYQVVHDRDSLRDRLGLARGRQYILHIARFHPVKDHRLLVESFALLAADHPEVDLLLVGDGPLRAEMEQRVGTLGLTSRVRFLGIRPDVPDLLASADVFALPSVSEAASLTLMEAMASGLPVVVTDVGGNPELVTHGVEGLLIPRRDARAGAEALRMLLSDRALRARMGQAAAARARSHYRLDTTVQRYAELYARLGCRNPTIAGRHAPLGTTA